jgi:hypothetical protein
VDKARGACLHNAIMEIGFENKSFEIRDKLYKIMFEIIFQT